MPDVSCRPIGRISPSATHRFVVAAFCFVLGMHERSSAQQSTGITAVPKTYDYYYKGRLVSLNASGRLLAIVEEGGPKAAGFIKDNKLRRLSLSDREGVKIHGVGLYEIPHPADKSSGAMDAQALIQAFADESPGAIQPVFEQGQALLIPTDEVIVGFREEINAEELNDFIAAHSGELGIVDARPHRKNTLVVRISNPVDGRCYQVSQALNHLDGVVFAEPNHAIVMLNRSEDAGELGRELTDTITNAARSTDQRAPGPKVQVSWTTIGAVDCESPTFPPAGWTTQTYTGSGYKDAYWGRTSHTNHGGGYSTYCALNGTQGVAPPGPVPTKMATDLDSPIYDLTPYEEVYIQIWFYAKNDLWPGAGGTLYDYCTVYVVDDATGSGTGRKLGSYATGDCTADPTTDGGWRKCVFRVPPDYRVSNGYFKFRYLSDTVAQYEGCYLDDIQIVGATDVDTEPLGNDTFSARHWDMRNAGQVAGLGGDDNDQHLPETWTFDPPSPLQAVVAIIDDGVDLTHPDLNLVRSYDFNGTPDQGFPRDSHGTACAGEAGAISNNAVGVIGTAPAVRIMPVYRGSTWADFADAIDVAVAHGARVLSNSWGQNGGASTDIEDAIDDALSSNCVVLFAAGNGPDRSPWNYDVAFPANLTASKDVICVGASSPTDEHKAAASSDGLFNWGSSYVGDGPDICAPGCWSYTTDRQGADGYNAGGEIHTGDSGDYSHDFGGTSASTPKVAGIVALLLSANPSLTPGQVKSILRDTADDIDTIGIDDKTGAGRVNASNALHDVMTDMVLSNETVTVSNRYYSLDTITARDGYVVDGSGSVSLNAADMIRLQPGFVARDGCLLKAKVNWQP
ncbi:S8 family serine peptidase [Verrucomicrobiota bacterium]